MIKTLLFSFLLFGSLNLVASPALPASKVTSTTIISFFANTPDPGVSISIFPNPTTEFFSLFGKTKADINKVFVFNMVGKRIKAFDAQKEEKFSVSDLPSGMYLVQMLDASNKVITTQRLQKR